MRTQDEYLEEFKKRDFWPTIEKLDEAKRTAKLTVSEYSDLTFDQLQIISEVFGTKNINLGSETRTEGYCESCSYTTSLLLIYVHDIGSV